MIETNFTESILDASFHVSIADIQAAADNVDESLEPYRAVKARLNQSQHDDGMPSSEKTESRKRGWNTGCDAIAKASTIEADLLNYAGQRVQQMQLARELAYMHDVQETWTDSDRNRLSELKGMADCLTCAVELLRVDDEIQPGKLAGILRTHNSELKVRRFKQRLASRIKAEQVS